LHIAPSYCTAQNWHIKQFLPPSLVRARIYCVNTLSTATFCCAWHVISCQCKKCVSKMSIVIDIDLWADILGVVGKNVSDVSRRVSCVSNVCQLWGNLPTDIKSTYPAKKTMLKNTIKGGNSDEYMTIEDRWQCSRYSLIWHSQLAQCQFAKYSINDYGVLIFRDHLEVGFTAKWPKKVSFDIEQLRLWSFQI
jgi:hypothetical protein